MEAQGTLSCPSCGDGNREEARFCDGCGEPMSGSATATPTRDVRAYTPSHLVEKILTSRAQRVFDRHDPGGALVICSACAAENRAGARVYGACAPPLTLTGRRGALAKPSGVHHAGGRDRQATGRLESGVS